MNRLTKDKDKLIAQGLCDHCLGRQFAKLGYGMENYERGAILRKEELIDKEVFTDYQKSTEYKNGGSCFICEGIFEQVDTYSQMIIDKLKDYSINTMLVGTSLTDSIETKEEELWQKIDNSYSEPIKTELNRLVGKQVLRELQLEVDLTRPDLVAVIDLVADKIDLQINSMLIYGKYNKYRRGISQTKWFKDRSIISVEELVSKAFVNASEATDSKFHGAGREDIDVRCFAQREFVLELLNPKNRAIDLAQLKEEVNSREAAIDIYAVEETVKDKIKEIKEQRSDKIYRAYVKLDRAIEETELEELEKLVGIVKQRTPQRVDHRRSDIIRKREVYDVFFELIDQNTVELIIKAEAGTYIKELISGDKERTTPNVGQVLNCNAICDKLDVLTII